MMQIPFYESDESDIKQFDSDDRDIKQFDSNDRKEQQKKGWEYECRFESKDEALKYIYNENCWSLKNTNHIKDGVVKYYRCNKVKSRGVQCESVLKLIQDMEIEGWVLHRTKSNHTCMNLPNKSKIGLSTEVKIDIKKLYHMKFKPKAILENLQEKYQQPPNLIQIKNYLSSYKASIRGKPKNSLKDLEK